MRAVTREIAGELEATYTDEKRGVAVERLRAFASA